MELLKWMDEVRQVRVASVVDDYLLSLVQATRAAERVDVGVSPRGAISLRKAAQARALLQNRDHVIPDDIKALAIPVLAHRLIFLPTRSRTCATSLSGSSPACSRKLPFLYNIRQTPAGRLLSGVRALRFVFFSWMMLTRPIRFTRFGTFYVSSFQHRRRRRRHQYGEQSPLPHSWHSLWASSSFPDSYQTALFGESPRTGLRWEAFTRGKRHGWIAK